jgi:hypothetical protein
MAATVSLCELWTICSPSLVPPDATPAQRELARQVFYGGAIAILGALADASRDGDMGRVKFLLDRVRNEIHSSPTRQ